MTTPTREQVVQWAKQAWDDTGEGWTDSRWFDERAPSFEAFATLARADLEAELESLRNDAACKTPNDEFENAIRKLGVIAACEWFGYASNSEFTSETIKHLEAPKEK